MNHRDTEAQREPGEAQLLTYLRLAKIPKGLIINFNVAVLKNGIRRMVL